MSKIIRHRQTHSSTTATDKNPPAPDRSHSPHHKPAAVRSGISPTPSTPPPTAAGLVRFHIPIQLHPRTSSPSISQQIPSPSFSPADYSSAPAPAAQSS